MNIVAALFIFLAGFFAGVVYLTCMERRDARQAEKARRALALRKIREDGGVG